VQWRKGKRFVIGPETEWSRFMESAEAMITAQYISSIVTCADMRTPEVNFHSKCKFTAETILIYCLMQFIQVERQMLTVYPFGSVCFLIPR